MDKKIVIVLLIGLIALMFVPFVAADFSVDANYKSASVSVYIKAVHPSATSSDSAAGECFTANTTGYLDVVSFAMAKNGVPEGLLRCAVALPFAGTTYGTDMIPNGINTVAISNNTVSMADLQGSYIWFNFTFDATYQLVQNQEYCAYVYAQSATVLDGSDCVRFSWGLNHNLSNKFLYHSSAWTAYDKSTNHVAFQVYAQTDQYTEATPTPTPPVTAAPTVNDGGMSTITDTLLPILVPLLIVLIPAFLGLKFVGAWGFMAGLNVGVIIAYVILANTTYAFPLWGVVFIGIVDVLLVMKARG